MKVGKDMNKKLVGTIILGGVLGCSLPITVLAEDTTSEATVQFIANDGVTDPIEGGSNGGTTATGNSGTLRIDGLPNFDFSKHQVGQGTMKHNNTNTNSNLQVTDGRGTLAGWTVSVTKTPLTSSNDSNTATLNETLTLATGNVKNSTKTSVNLKGTNNIGTVVVNDAAQTIFAAEQNEGGGTYYENFDGDSATLSFNTDNAKVGTYTSTLTWTLASTVEGAQ